MIIATTEIKNAKDFQYRQVLELNPETGSKRPFEVYTERYVDGKLVRRNIRASYATEKAARKAWF